jgi:hypothetical protein
VVKRSGHTRRDRAPPSGELAVLLATERRLGEEVAAARAAAEAMVAEARLRAERAAPPAEDLAALAAAFDGEEAEALAAIAGDLERRLARHREAGGARLDELAEFAVALLLARFAAEAPP